MSVFAFSFCMSVPRKLLRVGFVGAGVLAFTSSGRAEISVAPADAAVSADAQPAVTNEVPAALREALGWQQPAKENYRPYQTGSAFTVKTDPSKWAAASALADAWVASAPEFARDPVEHLFRRMARVEALVLNATDPEARSRLKKESVELAALAQSLRDAKPPRMQDWQARQMTDAVREVNKKLGGWLADTPAERLAVFREELAALQPPDRKKLAAAYGGEEKLAALIVDAREYNRLMTALNVVQQDQNLKGEDKKQAMAKAMGTFGFFQGYHYADKDLNRLMQDETFASEISVEGGGRYGGQQLTVPELVEWTDEAGAEALLREAYALPVSATFDSAPHTQELAKNLILSGKIIPKAMPWALFEWPGDRAGAAEAKELAALYDALHAHFGEVTESRDDWQSQSGIACLATALAGLGRAEEATVLFKVSIGRGPSFPYHGSVDKAFAAAVWDFLIKTTGTDGKTESWSALSNLAPKAGRSQELVAWATQQAQAAPAGSPLATTWRLRQGWSLVAVDDPDAALAILVPIFDHAPETGDTAFTKEWAESAERLLKLADALNKPDLGVKLRSALLANFKDAKGSFWENQSLFVEFAREEFAASNAALIEQLLRNRLTANPAPVATDSYDEGGGSRNFPANDYSSWLADAMARQGRHEDVVKWLAESPFWANRDLVRQMDAGRSGDCWRPLALVAAESLHATGRDKQAIAILEAYLPDHAASDPAFALYTSIRGVEAIPFLEKLRTMDHYEERPLIWKANVLLAAGRIDEAEATVTQAIAVDPSDGGEPHGDRMRAYAVAREIALKKGDVKRAEFLGSVVGAIRQAEAADDLAEAGLISRAIVEYQQALYSFSDAYCIQSRLAIRLAGENRMDEAIEHYKKAYELMPDSFGRVESHCFGCEKAFVGEQPQAIAERVFTALIAKPPVKPQAFYLMGYLRMEQERWDEAAGYFTQAVEADPEYLNAWEKLGGVLPHTARPRAERDRVAFQLFTLDPYQRHGSSGLSEVRDLPALWKAAEGVDRTGIQKPEKLYALGSQAPVPPSRSRYSSYHSPETDLSPAGLLARHDVLELAVRSLDNLYQMKQNSE